MRILLLSLLAIMPCYSISSEIDKCEKVFKAYTLGLQMINQDNCKTSMSWDGDSMRFTAQNFTFGKAQVNINFSEVKSLYFCKHDQSAASLELRYMSAQGDFVTLILEKDNQNKLQEITVSHNISYVWCRR